MALPKQVQAQLDEVEELEKSISARNNPPEEGSEETEVEEAEPEAEAVGEPEEVEPADTSPTDVADDFEQKYRTLRGKYDAEVPRLHQQVRDLTAKVEALAAKPVVKQPDAPTKAKEKVSLVTEADRAEFGEELLDVQRRVAQEVAQGYEGQLESQAQVIEQLRAQISNTGTQVGEMNFQQRLAQLVPDFAVVDQDERWVSWLNEYDPILRGPRRSQAAAAFEAGDAEAVAHYVDLFRKTITEVETPAKAKRQTELEKQVTPGRSAAATRAQPNGQNAKVYSNREVDAAWKKIRTLNTQGKLDDAAKLEAEITAAYLEGRVR